MKNDQTKYTDDQFLQDFSRLIHWAIAGLRSHGAFTHCAACGSDTTSRSCYLCLSDGTYTEIHAVCETCMATSPVQKILNRKPDFPANYIVVPENADQRHSFAEKLVLLAARFVAKEYGLPIVRRPLFCDGLLHPAEGFIYNKLTNGMGKARTVVPWKDDDPLFLGGRMARDAERIRLSLQTGDSEVTLLRGGGMLMTASEELIEALSQDVGGANHG